MKIKPESDGFEENIHQSSTHSAPFFEVLTKVIVSVLIVVLAGYSIWATFKVMVLKGQLNVLLAQQSKTAVTNIVVKERLEEIGELATEAYEYEGYQTIENVRQVLGISIPGTANSIGVSYCGIVKVGFDVTEIHPEVNEATKKIYITIPNPKVLDSYIKLDDLQFDAKNNILNPIDITKLTEYFGQIEQEGISNAEKMDIFNKAEERMKRIIESFLAGFSEYEVIFI